MSDTILQFVLSDLRPQSVHDYLSTYIATLRRTSLLSKLKAEADIVLGGNASKKTTVDTHRGGDPVFLNGCPTSHESFFQKHTNSVISFAKLILILLL